MSAAVDQGPGLLPLDADKIPAALRRARRWAPWAAPWDPERKKYDKVPHRADRPASGLSNGSTSGWVSFEQALAAYRAHPHLFAGVGYLMTGHHGVVGVDLDYCVKDGVVAPWAAEIVAKLDSYTEISPSGTGLHVMLLGDLPDDWSVKLGDKIPKQPGIDVYGGGARFLTVTGAHYPGSPPDLRKPPAGALDNLAARYRKSKDSGKLHVLPLPDIHGIDLPELDELGLPSRVANLLEDGPDEGADRSALLISTGVALAAAGLTPEQAFAVMVDNYHIMDIALSKRGYDDTKAREYLWTHHCRRGAAIIDADRQITVDTFNDERTPGEMEAQLARDIEELIGATPVDDQRPPQAKKTGDVRDDFDIISDGLPTSVVKPRDLAQVKGERFAFLPLDAFLRRPPMTWVIKGFLPRAGLCVLFGASGSGKTFLALDQAMCISRGVNWRGARTAGGAVAYVVAEGQGGFRDRVDAYCRENNVTPGTFPFHVLGAAPNMMLNADMNELRAQLRKLGPLAVIYLDTYARVMGDGNENEAKDTNKIIANCEVLHKETGAIVVLIHHSGKDATKGARGSGALRAAADVELEVVRTNKYRAVTVSKMKDGEDGGEHHFRLNNVTIGVDEDGDARTSCVVEHIAKEAVADVEPVKPLGPVQARIVEHLATYISGEVDRETFINDLREITPRGASGVEDPNWKMKITKPLAKLIEEGLVIEISGCLSLPANIYL